MASVDEKTAELLEPIRDEDVTPDHRAWMNAQIRQTLDKMNQGDMTYHSLDEVMLEFGF